MRNIIPFLVLLALLLPYHAVEAARDFGHNSKGIAPVVVEWLSNPHPKAGQVDVVMVRFVNGTKPIAGARLSARLQIGKETVRIPHGSVTDAQGTAHVGFRFPTSAAGTTVRVVVLLDYRHHTYAGHDDVPVR